MFTRNGHDWTDRYPLIVEPALKNRSSSFVIDGEAVLLGVDGVSDLHSRKFDPEVQLYAFDTLMLEGEDLRQLPLSMRKTNLARLLPRRPEGIFVCAVRTGRDRSGSVQEGLRVRARGFGVEASRTILSARPIAELGQGEKPEAPGNDHASWKLFNGNGPSLDLATSWGRAGHPRVGLWGIHALLMRHFSNGATPATNGPGARSPCQTCKNKRGCRTASRQGWYRAMSALKQKRTPLARGPRPTMFACCTSRRSLSSFDPSGSHIAPEACLRADRVFPRSYPDHHQ
jgi:hypothetical protein